MDSKFSHIVARAASALYRRGLANFNPEMQQYMLSQCALGCLACTDGDEKLAHEAEEAFCRAWFDGKAGGALSAHLFDREGVARTKPLRYLIIIFSGITMRHGDKRMKSFSREINDKLKERNADSLVRIVNVAAYDDTDDGSFLNDGVIGDAVQVVLRAYLPKNRAVKRFSKMAAAECAGGEFDRVIYIGYSGGGVVATRAYETLKKSGEACNADMIIRIGAPLIETADEDAKRTVDIIIPGDPVPLVEFKRLGTGQKKSETEFLINTRYTTLNPLGVHGLYFDDAPDSTGITNLEKTVRAALKYI